MFGAKGMSLPFVTRVLELVDNYALACPGKLYVHAGIVYS